ncbi:MAG TPA: hypothetical protein PKH31_08600 [Candidatus Sumerlaeota bacterium]|nr:hypothetical protein [Candidatus Sumerlaeota bacterium]
METPPLFWTPAAQVRRIVTTHARLTGIDLLYSLFYVLAGFFILSPNAKHPIHIVAAPFVILAVVLSYLTGRICGPEGQGQTAMFYANLPRQRSLTWWTHAAWLCAFAFVLELVIGLGMACRLNAARPDQAFTTTPFLILLPYFAIAFWMWAACCLQNLPGFLQSLVACLVAFTAIGIAVWDVNLCYESREPIAWLYLQNWPLAILNGLSILLFHGFGYRSWVRKQVGEIA